MKYALSDTVTHFPGEWTPPRMSLFKPPVTHVILYLPMTFHIYAGGNTLKRQPTRALFRLFSFPIKVRAGTIKLMAGMSLFLEFLVCGQRPPWTGVDSALRCYLWREVGSKQLLRLCMSTPGRCVH